MITSNVYSTFALLCFLAISQSQGGVSAINIECTQVKSCPTAMKLIARSPYAPETVQLLRNAHCGFDGNEPKIWCPILDFCTTPDSKNGTCKPVKECSSYINYLNRVDLSNPVVKKYVKAFRCDAEVQAEVRVCCVEEDKMRQDGGMQADDVHGRFLNHNSDAEGCGLQNNDNRIVGGTDTYLDEYPWLALLKYTNSGKNQYACSGTLINNQYIVTAAHCVDSSIIKNRRLGKLWSVVLGEYDTRNETDCFYLKYGEDCADPPQEIQISSYIAHPDFNATTMTNDVAIIRLSRKVKFTDYVRPICVPPKDMKLQGNETFMISGWGKTETQNRSPVKRKARVSYVGKENCNKYKRQTLNSRQLCVGTGNGTDTCYGDSGGPLMLDVNTGSGYLTFMVGVVSYGYGQLCGASPGVYTFIPSFADWIHNNSN